LDVTVSIFLIKNYMNITVTLSKQEVKGLKKYLASVSHDINPVITRADIISEIRGMVSCELQAGAVGDYIREES
jgi:hypothetical protein